MLNSYVTCFGYVKASIQNKLLVEKIQKVEYVESVVTKLFEIINDEYAKQEGHLNGTIEYVISDQGDLTTKINEALKPPVDTIEHPMKLFIHYNVLLKALTEYSYEREQSTGIKSTDALNSRINKFMIKIDEKVMTQTFIQDMEKESPDMLVVLEKYKKKSENVLKSKPRYAMWGFAVALLGGAIGVGVYFIVKKQK